MLKVEIAKRAKKCLFHCAGKINKHLHVVVDAEEHLVLIGLQSSLLFFKEGLFQLSETTEYQQVSLSQGKSLISLVANEHIVQVRHSLKVLWSLSQVNWDLVVTERGSQVSILAHDYLHIGDYRETVFFIDESVGSSPEDDIRDKLCLFINSMVLSNGNSHCEVVVWQVRANVFISQHYIYADDGILRILGSLKKQVYIDVLDPLEFSLTCCNVLFILFVLGNLLLGRCSWGTLWVRFLASCSGCCLWVRLSRRCLCWGLFLVILLLVFFLRLGITRSSSQLGLLAKLFKLNLEVRSVEIFSNLFEAIWDICGAIC